MASRLLDTNIVSFILNQHSLALTYLPHTAGFDLAISFQTLAELLEGGALANWGQPRWAKLDALLATMIVLDGTQDVAGRWAEIRAIRRARPIGAADWWIAATALAHGLELVTHNPTDFAGIPGLVIITEAP